MLQSLNLIEATIYKIKLIFFDQLILLIHNIYNKIKKQSNINIHIYYVNCKIDTNVLSKHLFLLHNHYIRIE